jgi:hypothetical protein
VLSGSWRRAEYRRLIPLLLGLAAPAGLARAQDSSAVRLDVGLSQDSTQLGARTPIVRTYNLLADTPWLSMLRSGFPVRLHYRLEIWRSRSGWFDDLVRAEEWDVVARQDPLLDQYTVTRLVGRNRVENRYATAGALAAVLGLPYRIKVAPGEAGTYYYVGTLEVTTLSDSDLDELQRFFKGELQPTADTLNSGTTVSRGARRLMLRLAGLPTLKLTGRSDRFEVR